MDIVSLTSRLVDHIKPPDPVEVDFTINLNENYEDNQILQDFVVTIEDPHFNDILSLLSNTDKESLLFPIHVNNMNNVGSGGIVDNYIKQMNEYDKKAHSLIELLKKHLITDFLEVYYKDNEYPKAIQSFLDSPIRL